MPPRKTLVLMRHLRTQFLDGVAGPIFLHKAEHRAAEDHGQHDAGVDPLAQKGGNNRGEDQDQNERAFELAQQQPERRGLPLGFNRVWPVLFDAALGVGLLEAVIGGVQRGKKLLGGETPIGLLRCEGLRLFRKLPRLVNGLGSTAL